MYIHVCMRTFYVYILHAGTYFIAYAVYELVIGKNVKTRRHSFHKNTHYVCILCPSVIIILSILEK